jgi:hypothetical protein
MFPGCSFGSLGNLLVATALRSFSYSCSGGNRPAHACVGLCQGTPMCRSAAGVLLESNSSRYVLFNASRYVAGVQQQQMCTAAGITLWRVVVWHPLLPAGHYLL